MMRRLIVALMVAGVTSAVGGARAQQDGAKLLVLLVVDQLRAADIGLYESRWQGGLRTLLEEGARFTRAEYSYLNTATCAGHATIATGALPSSHGIILNRWWHRAEGRSFNCMDDQSSRTVSYGAPSAAGNSAKRLLVPTLADELRAQEPGARVVSLALKPRGSIALAGRGGDVVLWFDEGSRSFATSTAFAPAPVPAVAAFIAANPPEAALDEAWTLQRAPNTYRNEDLKAAERPKAGWTALFPHALAGATGADAQFFERWQKSPFSDAYLARMALALVDDLELGRRAQRDFLAISFSALDLVGHDFGADSREAEDLLIRLDHTIGTLLQRLDEALGRNGYVVALTSDHGVAPVPEQVGGGRIASEDLEQLLNQTLADAWGRSESPYVAWVGPGAVYFGAGVFDRLRSDEAALERVLDALLSVPGIARVLRSDRLDAREDPLIRAALAGYSPSRTADLLLVPQRHWIFELRGEYDATNHGTFHDYDRRVPILLRGPGVRPGRYSGTSSPADVAPTLAHVAGLRLPKAEGRVLSEALRGRSR
jgi:predicted AlkP superfamily pyrophosphatase or phosphodiesterase